MLVRIFTGADWASAAQLGDFAFDQIPAIGHKLALIRDDRWACATVRDVVHRVIDGSEAADVALLLGSLATAPSGQEPLPFALLDGAAARSAAPTVPPAGRASPWGS